MKRSVFTVWEFLLVIVIIFIVAALLYPVFTVHHVKNPRSYCASNLKQLSLGLIQYEQDNDEYLPNVAETRGASNTWRVAIFPYCKSKGIYQCPSRADKSDGSDGFPRSYAANYTGDYSGGSLDQGNGAFAGPGVKPIWTGDISNPSALITLCEVTRHSTPDFNIDNLAVFNPNSHDLWAGHTGGSNDAFADGHVKWYKPEDTKDYWHRDKSIPLTPAALAILGDAQKRAGS